MKKKLLEEDANDKNEKKYQKEPAIPPQRHLEFNKNVENEEKNYLKEIKMMKKAKNYQNMTATQPLYL